jgi:hypothetical protein
MRICTLRETALAHFCHFSGRFSSLPAPKTRLAEYSVRANICSSILAQEVLKKHSFCYELGMDEGAQLDWRGYRCKKSGALADTEGGNPIELLLLYGFDCNCWGDAHIRAPPLKP